jgi:hypothetical protein
MHSSVRILIFFVGIVGKSADLAVIVHFLFKGATVVIGADGFVIFIVVSGLLLDNTDVLCKLLTVNKLRFSDSELHLDDVFLNVPPSLKHLNFELIDRVQVLFPKLNHLPLHLAHKFVHDHSFGDAFRLK